MHSIREMCGTDDVDIAYKHFVAFFEVIATLRESISCPPSLVYSSYSLHPLSPSMHKPLCPLDFDLPPTIMRCAYTTGPIPQEFSQLEGTLDVDSLPPAELLGTLSDVPCNHIHGSGPRPPLVNVQPVAS